MTFTGFDQPEQNWSKLPHAMIDALPNISSVGELKIIMYILRHTWGFHDSEKKITLDEFQHGRKRNDGTRFDGGTGLSKPTILSGIERAIEHGFICVDTDANDKARVKKFYSLNMSGVKNLYTGGKESLHRTEKDTLEEKQDSGSKNEPGESEPNPEPTKHAMKRPVYCSICDKDTLHNVLVGVLRCTVCGSYVGALEAVAAQPKVCTKCGELPGGTWVHEHHNGTCWKCYTEAFRHSNMWDVYDDGVWPPDVCSACHVRGVQVRGEGWYCPECLENIAGHVKHIPPKAEPTTLKGKPSCDGRFDCVGAPLVCNPCSFPFGDDDTPPICPDCDLPYMPKRHNKQDAWWCEGCNTYLNDAAAALVQATVATHNSSGPEQLTPPDFWRKGHSAIVRKIANSKSGTGSPQASINYSWQRYDQLIEHGYLTAVITKGGQTRINKYQLTEKGEAALTFQVTADLAATAQKTHGVAKQPVKTQTKRAKDDIDALLPEVQAIARAVAVGRSLTWETITDKALRIDIIQIARQLNGRNYTEKNVRDYYLWEAGQQFKVSTTVWLIIKRIGDAVRETEIKAEQSPTHVTAAELGLHKSATDGVVTIGEE